MGIGTGASARDRSSALPKILYVGGFGRSGSTLIGRVLGEASGAICLGETRYVWSRGLLHNVQCGCGAPFRECPFWSAVGDEAFGGWDNIDLARLVEVDHSILLLRTLPIHWAPFLRRGFAAAISEYVALLTKLYGAIGRVSGAKTIIDISKDPNFASLLMRVQGSDIRTIHLVRDSRAVAYSWTRNKRMPSPIGEQTSLEQFKPTAIAPRWLVWNVALRALALRNSPYIRIHYERFVEEPQAVLEALSAFADEELVPAPSELMGNQVKLGAHHMFSGNPMRASTGWVKMDLDDEWKTKMPGSQFAEVTAITWPQLRFYGYEIFPSARRRDIYSRLTRRSSTAS
jgi:hypothetical protein